MENGSDGYGITVGREKEAGAKAFCGSWMREEFEGVSTRRSVGVGHFWCERMWEEVSGALVMVGWWVLCGRKSREL